MKVSEAIDQLQVGDTVWVKGEVNYTNKAELFSICCDLATTSFWICDDDEISLTEPQAEKVEVPDFVAEWYESHKDDLEDAISGQIDHGHDIVLDTRKAFDIWFFDESDCPIETLIRMKDGYTVKPKRWVVKFEREGKPCYFSEWLYTYMLRGTGCWDKSHKDVYIFTDRAKAEAVAVLVEGTVEEV